MTNPPQKVSLYSTNELKNATDDALAPYLTKLPKPYTLTQNHNITNIRLAVGYAAVAIAGTLFYADWKLGWDATKAYTLPTCVAYFVLNGFLTYWIWAVESGTVFVGTREGGQKLSLRSSTEKHKPIYKLCVRYEPSSGSTVWENKEIIGNFTEWFNKDGYLEQKAFKSWLARNIEVIGLADPSSKQGAEKKYEQIVDDTFVASLNYDTTPAAETMGDQTPLIKAKKSKRKA